MLEPDYIGAVAGVITTISFFPQLVKACRTRSTKDLSLEMLMFFFSGIFLWLIYGIIIGAMPVIIANGVTMVLVMGLIILKIKYK